MKPIWKNARELSASGWNVLIVYAKCPAFDGQLLECGIDNTRPDESRVDTENRIAKRFNIKLQDLVLKVV